MSLAPPFSTAEQEAQAVICPLQVPSQGFGIQYSPVSLLQPLVLLKTALMSHWHTNLDSPGKGCERVWVRRFLAAVQPNVTLQNCQLPVMTVDLAGLGGTT